MLEVASSNGALGRVFLRGYQSEPKRASQASAGKHASYISRGFKTASTVPHGTVSREELPSNIWHSTISPKSGLPKTRLPVRGCGISALQPRR